VIWHHEGITCDGQGTPRGRAIHRVACYEDGEHAPGTCHLVRDSMTMSVDEAGAAYCDPLPKCRVCHPEEAR